MCVVTVMGLLLKADPRPIAVKSSLLSFYNDCHYKSSVHLNVDKAITYV